MPNNNILKCNICNKHLIFEEVQFHNHPKDYLDKYCLILMEHIL